MFQIFKRKKDLSLRSTSNYGPYLITVIWFQAFDRINQKCEYVSHKIKEYFFSAGLGFRSMHNLVCKERPRSGTMLWVWESQTGRQCSVPSYLIKEYKFWMQLWWKGKCFNFLSVCMKITAFFITAPNNFGLWSSNLF